MISAWGLTFLDANRVLRPEFVERLFSSPRQAAPYEIEGREFRHTGDGSSQHGPIVRQVRATR